MALKAFLPTTDGLAPEVAALYREIDSGWVLDVEPAEGWNLEDVGGLKTALSKERTAAEKARKALEAWRDLDPAEVRENLTELERLREAGSPDQKKKFEEQLKAHTDRIEAKYAAQVREANERATALDQRLKGELIDRHLAEAIATHQGLDHFLRPALRELVTVEEGDEGDGLVVRVLDKPGGDVKLAFPKGEAPRPMTVREFVGELKTDDRWVNAFHGASVGGSGGGQNGTGRVTVQSAAAKQHLASLSPAERIAAARNLRNKSQT